MVEIKGNFGYSGAGKNASAATTAEEAALDNAIAQAGSPMPTYMSPEALMAFVEGQLREIDERLFGYRERIDGRRAKIEKLNELLAFLKKFSHSETTADNPGLAAKKEEFYALKAELGDLLGDDPTLMDMLERIDELYNGGGSIVASSWEDYATKVQGRIEELSGSSEMEMIEMQQLMQERSRVIMFVTNALKSLNEPLDQVIRNIGA